MTDTAAVPDALESFREDQHLLYDAAWRKAEVFFDWRHKLMTFAITVAGAGIIAAGLLINNDASDTFVGLLLLFLAGVLAMTRLMDTRIALHMKAAYEIGSFIEHSIRASDERWKGSEGILPFESLQLLRLAGPTSTQSSEAGSDEDPASVEIVSAPDEHGQANEDDRGSLTVVLNRAYGIAATVLASVGLLIVFGAIEISSGDKPQKVELVRPSR
jgi:hypothetical protein